jgi:uncharacterized protein YggE
MIDLHPQRGSRAALIAVAAIALALLPAAAQAAPRVLAVTGQGSVAFTPDYVDLGFSVLARDKSYSVAQNRNLEAVQAAMSRLMTTFGMKREDLTTLDYSLSEEPVYDDAGHQTGRTYVSVTRMRARVRELGAYKAIIVGLLDSGVNGIDSISFGVDDWAALREKAVVAACQDAERKGKAMAAAMRVTLGKPLQIREAQAGVPSPLLTKAFAGAGNDSVISSGTQVLEAEVYVEYELR